MTPVEFYVNLFSPEIVINILEVSIWITIFALITPGDPHLFKVNGFLDYVKNIFLIIFAYIFSVLSVYIFAFVIGVFISIVWSIEWVIKLF